MYPRNAASPEPIAIGAVVQISDGAVQTSGCTVRIKPIGVAEGDGGGETDYSTDGIVLYTPTQAETNYTSFILIAKKTGCIPACVTVVTTASSVPGRTMPADGSITAAVIADNAIDTATFASGTTLPRVTLVDTTTTNSDMRGTDGANTTTPPTAGAIANEVQTRTIARVTLVDTCSVNSDMRGTDNAMLAASYSAPPTAAANATQVRAELATELARIDETIGSRLASASYTAPANSTIADISTRLPAALVGGKMDSIAELDSDSLRSALGMSAADLDAQLDAILAAASAGAGTGARTVTITVNDGTTALQNAVVRLTEGVNTFRAVTNASGVATFNLDDATYTVAITKSGYSYAGTTLVVDGTETRTYSMTVVSITPPDGPTKTVLTILCLDENGDADSGVNVSIRYVMVPTDSVDIAFPGASITKTSNGSGVATFQVIKGATIEYKRGTRDVWLESTMSDEDTTSITSFIGTP